MSLSILGSRANADTAFTQVSGEGTKLLQGPGDLVVRYTHTTRVAPAMIDLEGSTEDSILASSGPRIFTTTPDGNGETFLSFTGVEVLWSNRLRCIAIADGIDRFVPQILYLIRPETAFTSCLHYLARQLGGIEGYDNQRHFIIRNPGLTTLMPKFWQKVQEISWSGGFGPNLSREDTAVLLLALMECFHLTPLDPNGGAPDAFPCPHLPLYVLHEAGVYLPSIEYPEPVPTPASHALLTNTLNRANLPGIPTDLCSYIDCFVCGSHSAQVGETNRHECVAVDELKCTGCGLLFPSHAEYRIHVLTFCRQGPTSQGRCSCCNVKGPQCLCQQHWRKTYALVASTLQGNITRTRWLTPEYVHLLIDASVYMGWTLLPASAPATAQSPSPMRLRDSLWDPTSAPLPTCTEVNGVPMFLSPGQQDPASPDDIRQKLETSMGITLQPLPPNQEGMKLDPPASTAKATTDAAIRVYRERHIGGSGITVGNASIADLAALTRKIEITEEKLSKPKSAQMLSIALKMSVEDIKERVQTLTDLRAAIAARMDVSSRQGGTRIDFDDESDAASSHHATPDDSKPPFQFPHRKKGTESRLDGKVLTGTDKEAFLCRNETHRQETPPYRVFDSAGAKTAHLSRCHHCPYKRNTPSCTFFYEMEVDLGNHLLKCHPTPLQTDQCPVCDALVDKEHLDIHKQSVHSECTNCRTWFEDLEALKSHWDSNGGACQVAAVGDEDPPARNLPPPNLPRSLTLATLPDLKSGHEGLLTEALSIILDTAIPAENEAAKERAKDLITSYTFHQNHQRNISRNPYKAMSEFKTFLEIPNFSHPPTSKEKSFDKALDAAQIVELSPYTSERFSNYLKIESLHSKMLNYIKQYNLTEPSAVFLLLNHLSPEVVDVLRASYRRHPYELSYLEVVKNLQMRFYNLDLKSLRDSVGNLRRGNNEHHISFHTRCFRLCSLAAINFTDTQKAAWVESKVREIFYKSLDSNLRMEVDEMESRHGVTMSSTELLETYVCRANLKSTLDVGEDTLMSVGRVKEPRPARRTKRVGMVLSPGPGTVPGRGLPGGAGNTPSRPQPPPPAASPRSGGSAGPHASRARAGPPSGPPSRQGRQRPHPITPTNPRQGPGNTTPQSLAPPRSGPPLATRRDTSAHAAQAASRAAPGSNPFRPGTRLADKHDSIVRILGAMGTSLESLERDGNFCWSCGAGRAALSSRPYHARKQCNLPLYNGPAHDCGLGIKLMHEPHLCPRRRQRIGVVRIED